MTFFWAFLLVLSPHLWRSVLNKALPYAHVVIHDRLCEDLGVVLRLLDIGVTHHTAHVLDAAALGEHESGEGVAKVGLLLGLWDYNGIKM